MTDGTPRPDVAEAPWVRALAALHLVALANLAIGQPLLAVLGEGPNFLLAHGFDAGDMLGLCAAACWLLPAAIALPTVIASGVSARAGRALHLLTLGLLVALIALYVEKKVVPARWSLLALGAVASGGAAAALYARHALARSFCTALALGLVAVPAQFLAFSPAAALVEQQLAVPEELAVVELEEAPTTPVVLVVFDELGLTTLLDAEGRFDEVRYPSFAALARESRWYRNATTVADVTDLAVPALLTGRLPPPGAASEQILPHAGVYPHSLFTLLGGTHEVYAFESMTRLCPDDLQSGLDLGELVSDLSIVLGRALAPHDLARELPEVGHAARGFAFDRDAERRFWREARADRPGRVDAFRAALAPPDGGRPGLYVLHSHLPHAPWEYLPDGHMYQWLEEDVYRGPGWCEDDWRVTQAHQRHLLQAAFVDVLLGEVLSRLREVGLYDRCLLIVTTDHGISFRAGGLRRYATAENRQDLLSVPLLIKLPGERQGSIDDRNAELVDVLPTIADVLGVTVPWPVDGDSLLREGSRPVKRFNGEELPPDAGLVAWRAALEQKLARFGARTPNEALHAIGPHPELLGRSLEALGAAPGPGRYVPLLPARFGAVDLERLSLPLCVGGRLAELPAGAPEAVAIAIDGVIRAVSWLEPPNEAGERPFHALLPPSALRDGPNEVSVALIAEGADGLVLSLVPR